MKFDPAKINSLLGTDIDASQMKEYFSMLDLGFDESTQEVVAPTFRQDLHCLADLAEEVARFFGYDNIPSTLPSGEATTGKLSYKLQIEEIAREVAEFSGFSQSMTYSFESPKVFDKLPAIPGATWIDLSKVNGPLEGFDKDAKLLLVCAKGKRGYFLQNRLKALGYTNTKVLEGGAFFNKVKVPRDGKKLSAEEIKRVKGLGCLQDKRYGDVFNVRVITRNGKLTTEEQIKIAEAAEKFGSGEITMTTRLTLEIQGVNYDNLEPLFAFLC